MNKDNLPIHSDPKEDAYNKILAYMKAPEVHSLTSVEENILFRWTYCNTLLRDRKLRQEDIIEKISEKFSVSKFTARNDIGYTQALYTEATNYSKQYLLMHHIEDIGMLIEKWKLDKSLAPFVPKLIHEYTIAVSKLPQVINGAQRPAVVNNFFVVEGQKVQAPMDFEDAYKEADELIKKEADKSDDDYTDFEDLTDDSESTDK